MTMVSLGDMAQSFLLKSQTARLRGEAGRITQELASGQVSDVGAAVSGDFTRLAALSRARTVAQGYQSAAREVAAQASAMQSGLSVIAESARALVSPLLAASQLNATDQVALTGIDARARLDQALSTLNTSVAGRTVFAGQAVSGSAVTSAEPILTALRAEIAGAGTAEEAMRRIADWFEDPAGFAATGYLGGAAMTDVAVSPTDRVWMGVTANDPALRATLSGLAAASLITDGSLSLDPAQRGVLARLSGEALLAGQDQMTQLSARLGLSEGRIEAARSRTSAEALANELAQADLIRSDPERLAMELEAVQTNLETLFAITARLSRLNLTDFLR